MAKESSFDVVSTVDMQEVDNAFGQAKRELTTRYDLKDSGAEISLDKAGRKFTVSAPSDFVAKQVIDVLGTKLIRRGIDLASVKWGDPVPAAGQSVRQTADIVEGIDKETAGKINKDIKAQKLKVKVTIEGDKLRVSSASRDALQEVIAVAGGHTARHDQLGAAGREVVKTANLEDDIDALLGGSLNKRTGIDHHGIGLGGIINHEKTGRLDLFGHFGTVYFIFRTAQRNETDGGSGTPSVCAMRRCDVDISHESTPC